ncbi:hypothetical protein Tco_0976284 [Tanacetum coccineum]|uniref:Uncharacterized protein n=1 Tax=Tanacetum coccineum TaxID=301880 RepID=A0ABQ5EHX3_9ASTR
MAPKRATRSTPVTTTPALTATTATSVTNAQLQAMIDQGVTAALAARDANRNGDDSYTSGTGGRRTERIVKFSICTLLAGALTWWNSHVMIVSHDVAYAMTWADLRKKMTDNEAKANKAKPKAVRNNNGALIIEEWVYDNEEDDVPQAKIEKKKINPSFAKIEFVKPKQQEKTARKTSIHVEQNRQNIYTPRGNQRNWNNMMSQRLGSNFEMFNKACYVCGSFDHLVNHQNFTKKTYPCAKKNIVPRAVLMKSGLVSVNTVRQVNVAHTKTTVNAARPMSYLSKTAHSTVKKPIHKNTSFKNSNFNQSVNTVKDKNVNTVRPKATVNAAKPKAVFNAVKENNVNVVKASAY